MQIGWDWEDEIAGFWLTGLGYRRMRGGEVGSCLQRFRWYLWYTQDWMILTPKLLPLQFLLGLGLGKWSLSMHIPFYYKILQISRLVSKLNILFSHPTWWFTPVSKWLVRPLAIPEVKHQAIPSPSYETPPVTMVYSLGNKRIHFFCGKKFFFVVEDFIYIYVYIIFIYFGPTMGQGLADPNCRRSGPIACRPHNARTKSSSARVENAWERWPRSPAADGCCDWIFFFSPTCFDLCI